MDNLSPHEGLAIRRAILKATAKLLFLPPYSLDLNPDREGFCQTKGIASQSRRKNRGNGLAAYRRSTQVVFPKRMRKLFQKDGASINLIASLSNHRA
jgi:hypothetical protein